LKDFCNNGLHFGRGLKTSGCKNTQVHTFDQRLNVVQKELQLRVIGQTELEKTRSKQTAGTSLERPIILPGTQANSTFCNKQQC
jgi:hypothetical protein